MSTVTLRFYEELNDFLDPGLRKQWIERDFKEGTTVKSLVEELGIPHTEVDLVLVNGESRDFTCQLKDRDRIGVYPVFESFDIMGISLVRPDPVRQKNTEFKKCPLCGKIFWKGTYWESMREKLRNKKKKASDSGSKAFFD